ncbi:hypothetical protein BOX15_Mlig005367g7 [Macrostomum lignano]|uniref:ZMYM2-like/QRICH1 C-terminal domain-containing protein n=1 Tax=Macrostomum lignano TaxID=282301 RepID=A0A267F1B9_9PLAT|nr:hypothetical protein BOX15_Mlig005367g7 [Macrostomum lignano]
MASVIDSALNPPLIDFRYATVSGLSGDEMFIESVSSNFERTGDDLTALIADCTFSEELEKLFSSDPETLCNLDELESLAAQLERDNECHSTVSKEKAVINRLTAWLAENNLKVDYATASVEEIAKWVRYFYATLRKSDGSFYSPNTIVGIRAALFRYFMKLRGLNIIAHEAFHSANLMVKNVCNAYLKSGGRVQHYEAIESDDLVKLASYFDRSTPTRLQEEVYFNVLFYFGNRGREWLRGLTVRSFREKALSNGAMAIELQGSTSKNVKGSSDMRLCDDNKQALMVAKPESRHCPVQAFQLYLSKITAVPGWNQEDFFLRPKPRVNADGIWYTKVPVGINTLGPLLKKISSNANLSKLYTPHCVRPTVVTELHEAGFSVEKIAKVTGHKNSASVERYIRRGKKRDSIMAGMSDQLTVALAGTMPAPSSTLSEAPARAVATTDPCALSDAPTRAVATTDPCGSASMSTVKKSLVVEESTTTLVAAPTKRMKILANGETNVVQFIFE